MRRNFVCLTAALLLLAPSSEALAEIVGFTGPYAPAAWTISFPGNPAGGGGVSTVFTPSTLTITGGNSSSACGSVGVLGPCEAQVTTGHIENAFSFHWAYTTSDPRGAIADPFGVIVDGARTILTSAAGSSSQSGDFLVSAFTSFGWFLNCTDCVNGSATATVTDFHAGVTAIPEPGIPALLGVGMIALLFRRRRP